MPIAQGVKATLTHPNPEASQLRENEMTETPMRLRTLADLPDHSAKYRAKIPAILEEIEEPKREISDIEAAAAKASSELEVAEAQTSRLHEAARTADAKHAMVANAEFGAHTIKLDILRKKAAEVAALVATKIPELRKSLESRQSWLESHKKSVAMGEVENAIALYSARLSDANIAGLVDYIHHKFWAAGINIHGSRQHPILLDPKGSRRIEGFEVHIRAQHEDFNAYYAQKAEAEKLEAERPADETAFNALLAEIQA